MPYIANKNNLAQLTNIHYWDSVANAWSVNLIGAVTPFAFLPNPVTANDLVLFGIDSTAVNPGPFCSLVFDLGVVITGVTAITWRYSSAAPATADPTTWLDFLVGPPAIPFQDNTNQDGVGTGVAFDTLGVRSVHWAQPAGWVATWNPTIGGVALGVTGWWVCADVTAATGVGVPPQQANREIYSVIWPTINIPQPGGDLSALFRTCIRGETNTQQTRWLCGLRRTSRGADFRSFINMAAAQNPPGVTVASALGFTPDPMTPTGEKITGVPAIGGTDMAVISWSAVAGPQYKGTYRLFLRANQLVAPNGTVSFRVTQHVGLYHVTWQSQTVIMTSNGVYYEILDMGRVYIPGVDIIEPNIITWIVRAEGDGVVGVDLIDLVLIPVDEWAADIYAPYLLDAARSDPIELGMVVEIDGIQYPKRGMRALNYYYGTGNLTSDPRFVGGEGGLIPNVTQQLHSLTMDGFPTGTWRSYIESSESVDIFQIVNRYSSMRGAR